MANTVEYYCKSPVKPFMVFLPTHGEFDVHKASQETLKKLYDAGHKFVGVKNVSKSNSTIAASE